MPPLTELIFVAGGGALGSVLRYALALGSTRWVGGTTLAGTLIANLVGCFAIGLLTGCVTANPDWLSPRNVVGVRAGLIGGFTTFSTFAAEAVMLAEQGRTCWMAAYVVASVGFGLIAVWVGIVVAPGQGLKG